MEGRNLTSVTVHIDYTIIFYVLTLSSIVSLFVWLCLNGASHRRLKERVQILEDAITKDAVPVAECTDESLEEEYPDVV